MGRSTCQHVAAIQLRKRRRGQRTVVQGQCGDCREAVGEAVPSEEYTIFEFAKFAIWLPKRPSRPATKRRREYKKSLSSTRGKKLTQQVLARDNWTCRTCGQPATDKGHINYDHFSSETVDDFISQCFECNQNERQRRFAGGGARK